MRIKEVQIENFRLLRDVAVGFEDRTTLIVGRNNSGKTSIAELFRRLLGDKATAFKIEDFSLGCHERFWTAFEASNAGTPAPDFVALLPSIKVTIDITYDIDAPDFGPLSVCIVDLDPDSSTARLVLTYGPRPPFATKHGVKGAEFENVLVIVGRGWNKYNFGQMLEWIEPGPPAEKIDFFENNRNLFYVACSWPKVRLAILFTQVLSANALGRLTAWFGANNIVALPADPEAAVPT